MKRKNCMSSKEIKVGFSDQRNTELYEKINDVIYDFAVNEKMTFASVIGVLECVKLDMWYDENITY